MTTGKDSLVDGAKKVRIDIHAHAYRAGTPPQDGHTRFCNPDELLAKYDELGITHGVLLPLIGPETYLPQSNEDVLDMAEQSGGRLIPFCNIDPRAMTNAPDAPLGDWLRHYARRGCKGVGEVMANLPIDDPRYQNLFKHIADVGLVMTIDMSDREGGDYGLIDGPGLPGLAATLERFPGLRVLGHSNPFWAEIAELKSPEDRRSYPYPRYPVEHEGVVPALMRRYPNLYGDLSAGSGYNALSRDREYAIRFLSEFQDRLLFGTDICTPSQAVPMLPFLETLKEEGRINEHIFNKITHENAIRLLGLKEVR